MFFLGRDKRREASDRTHILAPRLAAAPAPRLSTARTRARRSAVPNGSRM
jgi:hypothetical protein